MKINVEINNESLDGFFKATGNGSVTKENKNETKENKVMKENEVKMVNYGEAIRETKNGKGRFDLIPSEVINRVLTTIMKNNTGAITNKDSSVFKTNAMKQAFDRDYVPAIISLIRAKYGISDDISAFAKTLKELAIHFQIGAEKYGERNCEKGLPLSSFRDSGLRHLTQYVNGETDEPHFISAIWNFVMAEWTIMNHPERCDELPKEMIDDKKINCSNLEKFITGKNSLSVNDSSSKNDTIKTYISSDKMDEFLKDCVELGKSEMIVRRSELDDIAVKHGINPSSLFKNTISGKEKEIAKDEKIVEEDELVKNLQIPKSFLKTYPNHSHTCRRTFNEESHKERVDLNYRNLELSLEKSDVDIIDIDAIINNIENFAEDYAVERIPMRPWIDYLIRNCLQEQIDDFIKTTTKSQRIKHIANGFVKYGMNTLTLKFITDDNQCYELIANITPNKCDFNIYYMSDNKIDKIKLSVIAK